MLTTARIWLGAVATVMLLVGCTTQPANEAGPEQTRRTVPDEGPPCPPTSISAVPDATVTFGPINGVAATEPAGQPLVIVGTVYAQDCRPLGGATLTMWQTDANGEYGPGHGTADMRCCYLGGRITTDANGQFALVTVRPGHYRGEANPPPAHIHLELRHRSTPPLNTEIVFADDDRLPAGAARRGLVVTEPTRDGAGWRAVADIVMPALGSPA